MKKAQGAVAIVAIIVILVLIVAFAIYYGNRGIGKDQINVNVENKEAQNPPPNDDSTRIERERTVIEGNNRTTVKETYTSE